MKFVALFALFCLAGVAVARQEIPRNEVVDAARGRLSHLDLDLAEDNKPVAHTRAPFEELELDATARPVTPKVVESGHVGGAERATEDHSEVVSTSTGFSVVTEDTSTDVSTPERSDTWDITTEDSTTDANTDAPATEQPTSDANTESGNTEKVSTESAVTDASNTGNPSTDSDSTDSTATDSTNTEPTEVDGAEKKSKGLSTASISAIVIGGVLALAVIVAVAMAIVRRRRTSPERRGILDA